MPTRHGLGHHASKLSMEATMPDDAIVGGWPRERLIEMDADFCAAMTRAIARGLERARPPDGERRVRAA
jgi:hypothetical protein